MKVSLRYTILMMDKSVPLSPNTYFTVFGDGFYSLSLFLSGL